jgi:hypothetical protein
MDFCMNKHKLVRAEVKVPTHVLLEVPLERFKDMVKQDLARLMTDEIMKNMDVITIDKKAVFGEEALRYQASLIVAKTADYRDIIDVIRERDYNIVDKYGRTIPLSELL